MQLLMGHIESSLHLLKERIFFLHVSPHLNFFKFGLCVFIFPHLLNFSQNLFCFSYFYRGINFFLNLCGSQGELLLFIEGVVFIFSYSVAYVFCLPSDYVVQSLSIRDKKGETQMTCLFCLGGEYKIFLMYLTQGESQNLF